MPRTPQRIQTSLFFYENLCKIYIIFIDFLYVLCYNIFNYS